MTLLPASLGYQRFLRNLRRLRVSEQLTIAIRNSKHQRLWESIGRPAQYRGHQAIFSGVHYLFLNGYHVRSKPGLYLYWLCRP